MSTTTTIPTAFGQGQIGTPGSQTNLTSIQNAAQGGASTASFMSNQIPNSLFMQQIGFGEISLIESTIGYTNKNGVWVDTNYPVTYAMDGTGANAMTMITYGAFPLSVMQQFGQSSSAKQAATPTPAPDTKMYIAAQRDLYVCTYGEMIIDDSNKSSKAAATEDQTQGTITIDGQEYNIYGSLTTTFNYSQVPQWHLDLPVAVGATVTSAALAKVALSSFLKPLISKMWKGAKNLFNKMNTATELTEESELLLDSTGEIIGDEVVEEGTEVAISAVGVACFGALFVVAAIPLVVSKLLHYSYHTIQAYNLSNKYDIVWQLPYIYNGSMTSAPIISEDVDGYEQLIGGYRNLAPGPHVQPQPAYGSANFAFASSTSYEGLGESFGFQVYTINPDATTASDYVGVTPAGYGAWACNIPWSGDNSLDCELSASQLSSEGYWNDKTDNQVTKFSNTLNDLKITVTFDYLSGEHPNNQGTNEYFYQTVLTFEDV